MTTRGRSAMSKMLASALKNIKKPEPQPTLAVIERELIGSTLGKIASKASEDGGAAGEVSTLKTKTASHGKATASRASKLLKAEEPEVLRPHCEKCGCDEALRPGLDCRCHCPHRRAASSDKAAPKKGLTRGATNNPGLEAASTLKQETMSGISAMTTTAFSRGQTNKSESKSRGAGALAELEHEMSKPDVFVRSESGNVKKETFSAACSRGRSKAHELAEVPEPHKEEEQEKPCEKESKEAVKEVPSASGCKRARSGCPKLAACSRFKTSALSMGGCSTTQNFALWSDAGRLRELDMICYCDACIGLRDGTCTSPRMAKFKKTGTGAASQSRQYKKTV
ncbi:hypothetical protein Emed_001280 [Eimeria media]